MNGATVSRVLLYSGGIDSHCLAWLWHPDLLLYVRTGAPYEAVELDRVQALNASGELPAPLLVVDGPMLQQYALPSALVPQRNALLCLYGAYYGNRIALGAVRGDRGNDKDAKFVRNMSNLVAHLWARQWWTAGVEKAVECPAIHQTKGQLLTMALECGMPAAHALAAPSCYEHGDCGRCAACLRKWVALRAAGLEWQLPDPRHLYSTERLAQMESEYDAERMAEVRHALHAPAGTRMY